MASASIKRSASVAVLTPYLYLQILFGALGGWLVFAHVPDAWSLGGIALIFAGGVFGTWLTGREMLVGTEAQSSCRRRSEGRTEA